ncbi:MAG: hypothetical protein LBT68_07545 [Spirochaetales bacterium]|nr:hypothetical protein [Spirochaetales bacterium]
MKHIKVSLMLMLVALATMLVGCALMEEEDDDDPVVRYEVFRYVGLDITVEYDPFILAVEAELTGTPTADTFSLFLKGYLDGIVSPSLNYFADVSRGNRRDVEALVTLLPFTHEEINVLFTKIDDNGAWFISTPEVTYFPGVRDVYAIFKYYE